MRSCFAIIMLVVPCNLCCGCCDYKSDSLWCNLDKWWNWLMRGMVRVEFLIHMTRSCEEIDIKAQIRPSQILRGFYLFVVLVFIPSLIWHGRVRKKTWEDPNPFDETYYCCVTKNTRGFWYEKISRHWYWSFKSIIYNVGAIPMFGNLK